MIGTACLMTVS